MSGSSADARAAIVTAINAANITGLTVDRVYDHEPNPTQGWGHPLAVTVSPAGFTPTEWVINVRVYTSLLDVDSKVAESELERVATAVDEALPAATPASEWIFGRPVNLTGVLLAHTALQVPREDYF